jgi:hypothetical protein
VRAEPPAGPARELGRISLEESLALTTLVVQKDPGRRSRYAVRWLRRLPDEDPRTPRLRLRRADARVVLLVHWLEVTPPALCPCGIRELGQGRVGAIGENGVLEPNQRSVVSRVCARNAPPGASAPPLPPYEPRKDNELPVCS